MPLRTVSAGLARVRHRRRWLHPIGRGYTASLTVDGGAGTGNALLDTPATHAAVVRLSKAIGTPSGWIDAYGLAFTLPDVGQDVLVTTSVLHRVPFLAPGGPWARPYTGVLAHRAGTFTGLLGALPLRTARAFVITLSDDHARHRPVATLHLGAALDPAVTERLELDPWHTGGGIVPVGAIQRARRPVYAGSREGRA